MLWFITLPARSRAEFAYCIGKGAGSLEQFVQPYAFVWCWPFSIEAHVARSVLDGRNSGFRRDISVTDISKSKNSTHFGVASRGEQLALGHRGRERMILCDLARWKAAQIVRAVGWHRELILEV